MSEKPIVTVQLSSAFVGPPADTETEIAILCDRPIAGILEFAAAHPRCFVFPFYTGSADAVPDLSSLNEDHVVIPCYVGNFDNPRDIIKQIMEVAYAEMGTVDAMTAPSTRRIILDETPP